MIHVSQFEQKNQFEIITDEGNYLQSYNTVVVFVPKDRTAKVKLDPAWDCSQTTMKYVNHFLGQPAKETRQMIKSGEYIVEPLNVK